ncbi:MAG: lactonase family protein [Bacteroidia bacterium]
MRLRAIKMLLVAFLTSIACLAFGQSSKTYLFVGTYTDGKPDKGIHIYAFDSHSGNLKQVSSGRRLTNPSFLTLSPDGQYVYACTDTKMPGAGSVSAFKFDSIRGSLTFLNKQPSGGENPVYLTTSGGNEFVVNANYTEGTISVFKTNPDGSLNPNQQLIQCEGNGPNERRQDKAHVHAAVFSPDFEYVFVPDLGADKIRAFEFNPEAVQPLLPMEHLDYVAVPGSGPRHFTFHPNHRFAYCVEELSGTVSAFQYDHGKLDSLQRIFAYSKQWELYSGADIHVSPDGLFLYASNRLDGENTIAIFSIDQSSGKLTLLGHESTYGDHPRNFTLDPSGDFLIVANQVTSNIVVFKRNKETGLLTKTGKEIKVPNASCLQMRSYRHNARGHNVPH